MVEMLLEDQLEEKKADKLADFLTGGYITHTTPIMFDVVQEYGLNVRTDIPKQVYELFKTFEFSSYIRPQSGKYYGSKQ